MSNLRVTNLQGRTAGSSPTLPDGVVVTGVATATSFSGNLTGNASGLTGTPDIAVRNITGVAATFTGVLTYEDVTNIDSVGIITARSDVSIADKIIHTGDTNTAIRFPAADTFTVETGGVERTRVTSGGLVGINTDSPTENLSVNGNVVFGHDQPSGNPGSNIGVATVRGHHVNSDADYAELYFANSKSSGGSTASIRAGRVGDNVGTNLTFYTQQSGGSAGNGSERLRITSTGNLTSTGTISDSIGPLRRLGVNGQSGAYAFVVGDAGKIIRSSGSGSALTLNQNIFTAGDMISVFNISSGNNTVVQGTGVTLYNTADAATGTRTIAAKGMCTIVCTASNEFAISGSQLT